MRKPFVAVSMLACVAAVVLIDAQPVGVGGKVLAAFG